MWFMVEWQLAQMTAEVSWKSMGATVLSVPPVMDTKSHGLTYWPEPLATGVEEYSKLNDSIYWRDEEGLYVNLFIASELNWSEKGFRLRQETNFPEQPNTKLVVSVDKPVHMAMRLRIPEWTTSGGSVKLNGKPLDVFGSPGGYVKLARTWKNGDHVELELPMHLHIEVMPDDPKMQAVLYGPLVLAGDLGASGLTEQMIVGPTTPAVRRLPADVPTFRAAGLDPASWIKPGDKPLAFRTSGQQKDLTLVPLNGLRRFIWSLLAQMAGVLIRIRLLQPLRCAKTLVQCKR